MIGGFLCVFVCGEEGGGERGWNWFFFKKNESFIQLLSEIRSLFVL